MTLTNGQDEVRRIPVPRGLLRRYWVILIRVGTTLSWTESKHTTNKTSRYDLGVIAEVVASDSFKSLFLQSNGDTRSGTVVALFTGGCFCGAFLASYTDPLGRRGTILMACCIFVVGGIIQTAGVVIAMLYVGRLIAGLGVGFLTMIIPIYQAELSHRKIRGKITSLQQLFNAIGQIFATWIGCVCFV